MLQARIPLVALERQHRHIRSALEEAIRSVIDSGSFIQGPQLKRFEECFAQVHGVSHVRGVSNGTDALALAMEAAGVRPGDEVLTVANTFAATAEAVYEVGAEPVFVDIDEKTHLIALSSIEREIGRRTRAIIPVHLYGNPVAMRDLMDLARCHGLLVVEDCAQAHLASVDGAPVGSWGDAGCFSFFPGKNLGALGDAGAVVTEKLEFARRLELLRDHGRTEKYEHRIIGHNRRMDAIQAAVLTVKAQMLMEWTERRRQVAAHYVRRLCEHGFQVVQSVPAGMPVFHLFVVEVSNREAVQKHLSRMGVGTGIHYPVPLHRQPAFEHARCSASGMHVTEAKSRRIISLPICGSISSDEVEYVCDRFLEVAAP